MAGKDVEVIIRAKDRASAAADKVAKSFKGLGGEAKALTGDAEKAGDGFDGLGGSLRKLESEAARVKSFAKMIGDFEKSERAASKMEASLTGLVADLGKLEEGSAAAAVNLDRLKNAEAGLNGQLDATKARLAGVRAEQDRLNDVTRQARADRDAYNAALKKTPDAGAAQKSAGTFLRGMVADSASAASGYRAGNTELVGKLQEEIAALGVELRTLRPELNGAVSAQKKFAVETEDLRTKITEERTALDKANGALGEHRAAIGTTSQSLGGMAANIEKVTAAENRLLANSAALKARITGIGAISTAPQPTVPTMTVGEGRDKTTVTDVDALTTAITNQRRVLLEAKRAWVEQEAVVKTLAAAMRAAESPTEEMGRALGEAQAQARAAKSAYQDAGSGARFLSAELQKVAGSAAVAATGADRTEKEIREMSDVMRTGGGNADRLDQSLRKVGDGSRQSLSLMQRLRGEVLSMTAGFVGLYSAIDRMGQSLQSQQSVDALTNRLGAAFDQDMGRVAREMSWLRSEADRLGVSLQGLGEGYGKFAIAADAANFSGAGTREIFSGIAEAGRVSKLSLDDLNGVYRAFEQIISKGKFSAEEVRGQLGDRLPGAFTRLAQAMDMSTAELDEAMKKGEVYATEANLLKYLDAITESASGQLPAALDSLAADIGRFQTDIFNAEILFAQGFAPAVREALQSLSVFFRSREGHEFFLTLGEVAGKLVKVLAQIPPNFDTITTVVGALIALKLGSEFSRWLPALANVRNAFMGTTTAAATAGTSMGALATAQAALSTGYAALIGRIDQKRTAMIAGNAATGTATVTTRAYIGVLGVLRTGLSLTAGLARGLWAAIGGLPGLVVTGIITGLTMWLTKVDEATAALTEHQRQLEIVKSAYYATGDAVGTFADRVKGLTLTEAQASMAELATAFESKIRTITDAAIGVEDIANRLRGAFGSEIRGARGDMFADSVLKIDQLVSALKIGMIDVTKFREELDKIGQAPGMDEDIKGLVEDLLKLTTATDDSGASLLSLEDAMKLQQAVIDAFGEDLTGLNTILGQTDDAADGVSTTMSDTSGIKAYQTALNELKMSLPGVKEEMEKLQQMMALTGTAWTALTGALAAGDFAAAGQAISLFGQNIMAGVQANIAAQNTAAAGINYEPQYTAERGTPQGAQMEELVRATTMLAEQMGLSAKDLLTVMSYETGGTFDPWKAGPTTQWGQHRGLIQWGEPQAEKYGVNANSSITEQVMAAGKYLTDAGVKSGDGLLQVYAAINAGDATKTNATDENNGGAPGTVLDKVNDQMGGHQARADGLLATYAGIVVEAEKLAQQEIEGQKATADTIASNEFELSQQALIIDGKAQEAAIEKAIAEAKKADPNISEDEIAKIREQVGALYELQNAQAGVNAAEDKANQLYALRQQLLEQLKMAQENGDTTMVTNLNLRIEEVNGQLQEAIASAIQMHQAVGGPAADASIAKLQTMAMSAKKASTEVKFLGLSMQQWGQLGNSFADGLVGVFDAFAQAVANGEDAMAALGTAFLKFAADFLRQIATMILKQMIMNALQSFFPGIPFGHTGGLVGSNSIGTGNPRSSGSRPQWASNALKYHTGGVAGLKPDEINATLQRNEEILTEEDPRHRFNQGGEKTDQGGKQQPIKQLLVIGEKDLANAMSSSAGEKVVVIHIKQNAATIRKFLGM